MTTFGYYDGFYGFNLITALFLLFLSIGIGSIASTIYYNLYRHPLRHIPGPKIAAAAYLYQTYFSLFGGSRYYIQVGKLHEKYGPVIRITPDEVHLSDPANYEVIYHMGSKYSKSVPYYKSMSIGYSTFTTTANDIHRVRRSRLNPFFSRKTVLQLEDIVHSNTEKLCRVMAKKFSLGEEVDLHHGFRSVSVDIISDYAFDKCYNLLDRPDLGKEFFDMIVGLGPTMWIFQQWPALQPILLGLPQPVTKAISPPLKHLMALQDQASEQILMVQAQMEAGQKFAKPTIFESLLTADPAQGYTVPPVDELKDEACSILGAASDTSGNAMTVAAYEVISDPIKYKKLADELNAAWPDLQAKADFQTLEKLPYLTGVVKEGIRLSFGVPGRLPRIVPEPGATFNGFHLPAGSTVSMGTWEMHHNEEYFPDSYVFEPERWTNPEAARKLDKAFVAFGKGSRSCVGINLAYCELYVVLGTLFRRFQHLKSNHLSAEDFIYDDCISSCPPINGKKLHVRADSGEKMA